MDEQNTSELESASAELLNWIRESAENASGFLVEQSPLFVQEYLAWYFWSALIPVIFLSIVILLSGALSKYFYSRAEWSDYGNDPRNGYAHGFIYSFIVLIASIVISCIAIPISTHNMVKVKVAPRVVIVDYVKSINK